LIERNRAPTSKLLLRDLISNGNLRARHSPFAMGILKNFLSHHLRPHTAKGDPDLLTPEAEILAWVAQGLPAPPPHAVKEAVVRALARRYGTRILVESGTYFGDMVAAMKRDFARIYSIELGRQLHEEAVARFREQPNVTLIHGDSGQAIKEVLAQLDEPALFWLDGHFSSGVTARGNQDTPVREELDAIFAARELRHVILIDDARHFGLEPAYPTIAELRDSVRARRPRFDFAVDVDIIRITPPGKITMPAGTPAS
jgi:hypothetical protein